MARAWKRCPERAREMHAYRFPGCKVSWAVAANPPPVRSPFPSRRGAAPHSGIAAWSCPKWPRHPRHRAAISVVPACRVSPYRWTVRSRWTFEDSVFSRVRPRRDEYFIRDRRDKSGLWASDFTFFVDRKLTDGRCQEANNVGSRWTMHAFAIWIFWIVYENKHEAQNVTINI